jgi:CheY-like chemotaxis protein
MTTVDEFMLRFFKVPRILSVLDDSRPVVELLHRNYECEVDATDSGEKAVELITRNKYDLVLVDLALLNGTSRRVLAAVRDHAPGTPVVATRINQEFTDFDGVGPLTVLSGPLTSEDIAQLFRVFKIKARTHAISEYYGREHATAAV